jgi:hypothetical protein
MNDRESSTPERLPPRRRTPASDDFPTGPAVGEHLPEFELADQSGVSRSLSATRAGDRALVVFYRTTRW